MMMRSAPLPLFALLTCGALLPVASPPPAAAQSAGDEGYQLPPPAMLEILDTPPPPAVRLSPDRRWLTVSERDLDETTIAELAEPLLMLAGQRFKPAPTTRIEVTGLTRVTLRRLEDGLERVLRPQKNERLAELTWVRRSAAGGELAYVAVGEGRMEVHLYDAATGVDRRVEAPGLEGRISDLTFTLDGDHLAFSASTPAGVTLWIADARAARAVRVPGVLINHVNGGFSWRRGRPPLIAQVRVPGAVPTGQDVPTGPIVQESKGKTGSARTYQDLLKSPQDEALFEYHFTNQVVAVAVDGTVQRLGPPGIHTQVTAAPGGEYLLVTTVRRPFSYQVPMGAFPRRTAVWDLSGREVAVVVDTPLRDNPPSARDAVVPGIRSVQWRTDAPATLVLIEALDGGDPRRPAPKRDRLSLLSAPFLGPSTVFFESELRMAGAQWIAPDLAFVTERSSRTARLRTWAVDPRSPAAPARLLRDRSSEDRYGDPGTLVMVNHPTETREVPLRSDDGRWLYLVGPGASKEGARPFLDRYDPVENRTERLWQSTPPHYEEIDATMVLDSQARRFVFKRESPTQWPNYFLRDGEVVKPLTDLPDPSPWFARVKGELVRYRRADGVELSATLYLPPDYDRARDGPLPFFLWAYPREFLTEEGASQVAGSPHQFKRPAKQDHLLLLTQGYGVLDGPAMPIVGKDGREPNDRYVEQLVASAQAAVDYLVSRGVADPDRLAVGGHSYGAFMTANLLAHCDLFRAGIARSGAYNRTLTPFGFQAEPRTYWQAPDIYNQMSPFTHAHLVNEPILLIHGMRDSNAGTFPLQSERMFAALKGNGATVRYVQLPLESHGYVAKESRRHVLWEMVTWLDRHVKSAERPARTAASRTP
jgi:dipeptidyl aminopeptidase/acylaminoacyl peptidase